MDDSVPRSLLLLVLLLLLLLLLLKATVRLETSLACSGPFAGKLSSTRDQLQQIKDRNVAACAAGRGIGLSDAEHQLTEAQVMYNTEMQLFDASLETG